MDAFCGVSARFDAPFPSSPSEFLSLGPGGEAQQNCPEEGVLCWWWSWQQDWRCMRGLAGPWQPVVTFAGVCGDWGRKLLLSVAWPLGILQGYFSCPCWLRTLVLVKVGHGKIMVDTIFPSPDHHALLQTDSSGHGKAAQSPGANKSPLGSSTLCSCGQFCPPLPSQPLACTSLVHFALCITAIIHSLVLLSEIRSTLKVIAWSESLVDFPQG